MTMVEVVFALSLLAVLAMAVASWTKVAARAAACTSGPDQWRSAANAVLQLLHDDVTGGDLDGRGGVPRVRVVDSILEIRTRASAAGGLIGPVVCRYRIEPTTDQLRLQQQSPDGTQRNRLLLDHVQEWQVSIDQETRTLNVNIAGREGHVSRRLALR